MAISYFGGKSKMSVWIGEFIPKNMNTYAEPFSGAFWVYFNKNLNYDHVPNIRYNDYNKHMTNLYACCGDYNKMVKTIETSLKSGMLHTKAENPEEFKQFYKDLYYDFKNNSDNKFFDEMDFNIPDYDVALKYAFLITSSFNACHPTKAGFSGVNKASKIKPLGNLKINALLNKLKDKKFQSKFERITSFENLDFEEFIKQYDAEDTFFYIDPPYFSDDDRRANWYGVKDTFGHDAHERLAKVLATTKAKWALSYYDYPELSEWFPKDKYVWANKEFFRSSASFSENKDIKGNELLIFNYDPEEVKNDESPMKEEIKKEAKVSEDIDHFWTD
jgi:DNA adenine methylase